MTVSELAKQFGVKVNDLAEMTGYTRQGLNNLVKTGKKTFRSKTLINELYAYTDSQYRQDIEKAEQTKNDRLFLITSLKKKFDESNG